MKVIIRAIMIFAIYDAGPSGAGAEGPEQNQGQQEAVVVRAEELVKQLSRGEFLSAAEWFDKNLAEALPPERLKKVWQELVNQAGDFKNILVVRGEERQGYHIIFVTCAFTKLDIDVKFVFDKEERATGLWFVPGTSGAGGKYEVPTYVKVEAFTDREVRIGSAAGPLPGTLSMPTGQGLFIAVVLVHGSGPQDRDESIGANKPFRDLAWGLATHGIAALRYEKRSAVYPEAAAGLREKFTVKEEIIDDAVAAVKLLRQTAGINCEKIYILGHSLGGMVAPRMVQADPNIAGLIILAGITRRLEDVYFAQMNYLILLNGEISPAEKKQLKKIKLQIERVKDAERLAGYAPEQLPMSLPSSYWLDLNKYNAVEEADKLTFPMLIMQGGRDYQATLDDFRGWKKMLEAKNNVSFKLYLKLNHLFIAGEGTGKSSPAEYQTPGHVAQEVVEDIADWLKNQ